MTHQSQSPAANGARQAISAASEEPASTENPASAQDLAGSNSLADLAAKTQAQIIRTVIEGGREVEQFDPERHRLKVAALDYGIDEAKRIKNWPKLEEAVDAKIDEQRRFVGWWDSAVREGGRPNKNLPSTREVSMRDAEKLTGMRNQRVSDLGKRLTNPDKYRLDLLGAEYRAAFLEAVQARGTQGTGENERFTPAEYIEMARAVLGEIDLDPATHEKAQETIRAVKYFTKDDDGLSHEWHGRVWLNPPYAGALVAEFAEKMVASWNAGELVAAFMLTNAYTETSWWHALAAASSAVCFTRGRIKFESPHGEKCAPTNGQSFFYFGTELERLWEEFSDVGLIMVRSP
jgi:phage N-6-adenine-methyltransferase